MRGFPSSPTAARGSYDLLELVSELLDAHADTVELLLADDVDHLRWCAHREYLQALQRLGQASLAHHHRRTPPALRPPLSCLQRLRRRLRPGAGATARDELPSHLARSG